MRKRATIPLGIGGDEDNARAIRVLYLRHVRTIYICGMEEAKAVQSATTAPGGDYGPPRGRNGKRLPWRNDDGSRRPRGPMRDGYQQWNISAPRDLIMALKREAKARRMTATAYMLVLWETHPLRTGGKGDGSI